MELVLSTELGLYYNIHVDILILYMHGFEGVLGTISKTCDIFNKILFLT